MSPGGYCSGKLFGATGVDFLDSGGLWGGARDNSLNSLPIPIPVFGEEGEGERDRSIPIPRGLFCSRPGLCGENIWGYAFG